MRWNLSELDYGQEKEKICYGNLKKSITMKAFAAVAEMQ